MKVHEWAKWLYRWCAATRARSPRSGAAECAEALANWLAGKPAQPEHARVALWTGRQWAAWAADMSTSEDVRASEASECATWAGEVSAAQYEANSRAFAALGEVLALDGEARTHALWGCSNPCACPDCACTCAVACVEDCKCMACDCLWQGIERGA